MRVFLGFGDAQLSKSERGEIFAERVVHRLRCERDRAGAETFLILRQGDERRQFDFARTRKSAEVRVDERMRQLARAIGAEVHEDDGVAIPHEPRFLCNGGLHEFVVLATRVSGIERGRCTVHELRILPA